MDAEARVGELGMEIARGIEVDKLNTCTPEQIVADPRKGSSTEGERLRPRQGSVRRAVHSTSTRLESGGHKSRGHQRVTNESSIPVEGRIVR